MLDRADLIKGLAAEYKKDGVGVDVLPLQRNNYINDTGRLNCSAESIPADTLKKTLAVIKQYEEKFEKEMLKSKEAEQYVYHLRVARKCVEGYISKAQ